MLPLHTPLPSSDEIVHDLVHKLLQFDPGGFSNGPVEFLIGGHYDGTQHIVLPIIRGNMNATVTCEQEGEDAMETMRGCDHNTRLA
jgi:hypothetical protein